MKSACAMAGVEFSNKIGEIETEGELFSCFSRNYISLLLCEHAQLHHVLLGRRSNWSSSGRKKQRPTFAGSGGTSSSNSRGFFNLCSLYFPLVLSLLLLLHPNIAPSLTPLSLSLLGSVSFCSSALYFFISPNPSHPDDTPAGTSHRVTCTPFLDDQNCCGL